MNRFLAGSLILLGTLPLFAADKTIVYRDCQVIVPGDWVNDKGLSNLATSADKKQVLTLGEPRFLDSFTQLKQTARAAYPKNKVTADTADNFEMEGTSSNGKPDVYRAIPIGGGRYCIAEVTFESGSAEQGKKILQSLKSK